MLPSIERAFLRLFRIPKRTTPVFTPRGFVQPLPDAGTPKGRKPRLTDLILLDSMCDHLRLPTEGVSARNTAHYLEWRLRHEYGLDPSKWTVGYRRDRHSIHTWLLPADDILEAEHTLAAHSLVPYRYNCISALALQALIRSNRRFSGLLVQVSDFDWSVSAIRNGELMLFRAFPSDAPFEDADLIQADIKDTQGYFDLYEQPVFGCYHPTVCAPPTSFLGIQWTEVKADL